MTTLGKAATGKNWRLFIRLSQGDNCSAKCAEMATLWFLENWPKQIDWPKHIPNLRECSDLIDA